MYKKFFLIVFGFLSSFLLHAQKLSVVVNYVTDDGTINKNNIYYQTDQLLSWDNFKGKPVEGTDAAALTHAGFGLKLMFRRVETTSQLVISVSCSFSQKDSWVKSGNKTSYILNHEQRHFDIAYIHTKLFMEKLKITPFTNTNYGALIEKIYSETAADMSKTQNQYDAETSHSRIPANQAKWDEKISGMLALPVKD